MRIILAALWLCSLSFAAIADTVATKTSETSFLRQGAKPAEKLTVHHVVDFRKDSSQTTCVFGSNSVTQGGRFRYTVNLFFPSDNRHLINGAVKFAEFKGSARLDKDLGFGATCFGFVVEGVPPPEMLVEVTFKTKTSRNIPEGASASWGVSSSPAIIISGVRRLAGRHSVSDAGIYLLRPGGIVELEPTLD